jgi:hypothetical protein
MVRRGVSRCACDVGQLSGSSRTAPTKPIAMGFDTTRKFEVITLVA